MNNYEKYGKKYYENNKEKFYEYRKIWLEKNPEKAKELQKKASKKYYEKKKQQYELINPNPAVETAMKEVLDNFVNNQTNLELANEDAYDKYSKARDIQYSA